MAYWRIGLLANDRLSLIEVGNAVELISWIRGAEGVHGRKLRVDNRGRVVWAIPGITPNANYSLCYVVHPAIGTSAIREKGRDRPSLHEDILRLRSMWSVAIAHRQGDHRPLMHCAHCQTPGDFECPCCLMVWHRACSAEVAARTAGRRVPSLDAATFPPLFLQYDCLCNLCMRHRSSSGIDVESGAVGINNVAKPHVLTPPR